MVVIECGYIEVELPDQEAPVTGFIAVELFGSEVGIRIKSRKKRQPSVHADVSREREVSLPVRWGSYCVRESAPQGLLVGRRPEQPGTRLQLDAGYPADQFASPGTASLTAALLDGGTAKRTALQISEEAALLGAQLRANAGLDTSDVSLSALKSNLDPSLELYADVILHPSFPETDFRRQQKQQPRQGRQRGQPG